MAKEIKVTLVRSMVGRPEKHRKILRALGLTRVNKTVKLFSLDFITHYCEAADSTIVSAGHITASLWLGNLGIVHLSGVLIYLS